jgi:hypothetical protein
MMHILSPLKAKHAKIDPEGGRKDDLTEQVWSYARSHAINIYMNVFANRDGNS